MRKIREVLRLVWSCDLSQRKAGRASSVARTVVGEYLERAESAGLDWAGVQEMDDDALEAALYPATEPVSTKPVADDWPRVHAELRKRKSLTLMLLWLEYTQRSEGGYSYSRYCELYQAWRSTIDLPMRQDHRAGERLFVDYAGETVPVTDPATGEVRQAEVFVAVLGASNYTFVEATWSQDLRDWTGSHIRTLEFFGGCPQFVIPDNLKSGVKSPCWYDPEMNPTYQELATHYGVAVLPARVRKPRDKAKVETGVQITERWILARLRNRTFFSLSELNLAIRQELEELNNRPFQKLPGTRRSAFVEIDQPALRAMPASRFELASWKKARVNIDYHVEVDGHYYSVPYQLVREQIEVRLTDRVVEMLHRRRRVASHPRSRQKGRHSTVVEHMPRNHREHVEWTPERLVRWASESGRNVELVVEQILSSRPHPEQGFRPCLGIMRLGKSYGVDRLDAACQRALSTGAVRYRSIQSILKNGLDREPLVVEPDRTPITHSNVRGGQYFGEGGEA